MTDHSVQIIYLNGPSSSGKTTLAKALQEAFEKPFLHVGIDKIIGWMPEKINDWTGGEAPLGFSWKKGQDEAGHLVHELQLGPFAQTIGKTFLEVVLTLAKMGHHLIIDDVSFGKTQVEEWKKALQEFSVLWVGVNAPLSVLEQREKERGNRIFGSARGQFHQVHKDVVYDLEIDTHEASPEQNAAKIKTWAASVPSHQRAYRKITRVGVYGVAKEGNKLLLVEQSHGPYAGRFDLPGGGMEFGETIPEALHREFIEEVGMDFAALQLIDNCTVLVEIPGEKGLSSCSFYQMGLIYSVSGLHSLGPEHRAELKYAWIDVRMLKKENVSPFVWAMVQKDFL